MEGYRQWSGRSLCAVAHVGSTLFCGEAPGVHFREAGLSLLPLPPPPQCQDRTERDRLLVFVDKLMYHKVGGVKGQGGDRRRNEVGAVVSILVKTRTPVT